MNALIRGYTGTMRANPFYTDAQRLPGPSRNPPAGAVDVLTFDEAIGPFESPRDSSAGLFVFVLSPEPRAQNPPSRFALPPSRGATADKTARQAGQAAESGLIQSPARASRCFRALLGIPSWPRRRSSDGDCRLSVTRSGETAAVQRTRALSIAFRFACGHAVLLAAGAGALIALGWTLPLMFERTSEIVGGIRADRAGGAGSGACGPDASTGIRTGTARRRRRIGIFTSAIQTAIRWRPRTRICRRWSAPRSR